VKKPKKIPEHKFIITERDIIELLTALSNDDVEPIGEDNQTYTLEQILANAGIVRASNE